MKYGLDNFPLIAEGDGKKLRQLPFTLEEDESDVYAISIGDGLYVGSTKGVRMRLKMHFMSLKRGDHYSPRMQEAFDRLHQFKAYLLFRCRKDAIMAECIFIRLLNPEYNLNMMDVSTKHIDAIWTPEVPDTVNHLQLTLNVGDRVIFNEHHTSYPVISCSRHHAVLETHGQRPTDRRMIINLHLLDMKYGLYGKVCIQDYDESQHGPLDGYIRKRADEYLKKVKARWFDMSKYQQKSLTIYKVICKEEIEKKRKAKEEGERNKQNVSL